MHAPTNLCRAVLLRSISQDGAQPKPRRSTYSFAAFAAANIWASALDKPWAGAASAAFGFELLRGRLRGGGRDLIGRLPEVVVILGIDSIVGLALRVFHGLEHVGFEELQKELGGKGFTIMDRSVMRRGGSSKTTGARKAPAK